MITVSKLLFSKSLKTYVADKDWFLKHYKEFEGLSFQEMKQKLKQIVDGSTDDGDHIELYVIMVGTCTKYTLAVCTPEYKVKYKILADETLYQ